MNKKIILPLLALSIYVVIIWPRGSELPKDTNPVASPVEEKTTKKREPRKPRLADPNFKPEVVKTQESKEEEKFFRTTAPEAIAYAENERIALEEGPGRTPTISKEQIKESKQLQSAVAATQDPTKLGSRLSPLIKAAAFDKNRFQNDKAYREEYLSTAEPARVYQVDDKSEYKLKRKSPYYQEVSQGESVFITVEAEPNMPVSITSFDLGKFANHLTYQTVLADAGGSATFEFFGMPGTFNDTKMLVSSPTSKGQLKFVVHTLIKSEKSN